VEGVGEVRYPLAGSDGGLISYAAATSTPMHVRNAWSHPYYKGGTDGLVLAANMITSGSAPDIQSQGAEREEGNSSTWELVVMPVHNQPYTGAAAAVLQVCKLRDLASEGFGARHLLVMQLCASFVANADAFARCSGYKQDGLFSAGYSSPLSYSALDGQVDCQRLSMGPGLMMSSTTSDSMSENEENRQEGIGLVRKSHNRKVIPRVEAPASYFRG